MKNLIISQPQSHIQAIDGLRGIAILSVVIHHWIIQPLSPLFSELKIYTILKLFAYGVDLFFVISGFLIGRILLKAGKKYSSIISFYLKRIFRIWPLYYLLLGTVFFLGGGQGVFGAIPYWSYFLFIFNFWESIGLHFHKAFGPLWSLSIEEQFYLAGPLLFFFLDKRKLMYLTTLGVMISPFLRLTLMTNTSLDIWRFTPVRLDGIYAGVFLSILITSQDMIQLFSAKSKLLKILTFLLLATSLICRAVLSDIFWYSFGNSVIVLSFGFLLTTVLSQHYSKQENKILSSVVLRYLGLRCYSIYLFHILFMLLVSTFTRSFFAGLVLQTILTLGFAHISWKYLEHPLIIFARRFSY